MKQILYFFINPEASMNELILGFGKAERKQGLLKNFIIIVLIGLLTVIAYQLLGINFDELLQAGGEEAVNVQSMSEGVRGLVIALIQIVEISLICFVRIAVWSGLLYVANRVLKGYLGFQQVTNIAVYSQMTWITIKLIQIIALVLYVLMPVQMVYEMVISLLMMMEYWYLILLGIAIAIGCRTNLLKAAGMICVMQIILWGIAKVFPFLQWILI